MQTKVKEMWWRKAVKLHSELKVQFNILLTTPTDFVAVSWMKRYCIYISVLFNMNLKLLAFHKDWMYLC